MSLFRTTARSRDVESAETAPPIDLAVPAALSTATFAVG